MERVRIRRAICLVLVLGAACSGVPEQVPLRRAFIDGGEVMALAAELAGPEYEGRMIGSAGGRRAADRLAEILEKAGFQVSFQEFPERPGYNLGEARLETILPGRGAETFEYRRDFRESTRGGWTGGSVEGPLFELEARGLEFPDRSVLLIPAQVYDPAALDSYAARGAAGALVELSETTPALRSTYSGAAPGALLETKRGMIVLAVSSEAYRRLVSAARTGARVRMASPVRIEEVRGRNIIAAWNGDGGEFRPAFAYTAHYDHVGRDADGTYFPGALDNASGTALAVRVAEALARRNPAADFALVLTDGEEVNLGGAWALARGQPFPLYGVSVVNLDMVGSRSDTALSIFYNGDSDSRGLAAKVVDALAKAGFEAYERSPVYNLDHGHLPRAGARAVSICEFDTARYHTKGDLPEFLSESELSLLGGVLVEFALAELSAH